MDTGQVVFRTYTTLGSCIAALPEPVALGLGNLVGDVLYRVRHEHRAMVKANLARVLGAEGGDAQLLDRWARRSFRAYARYWVEGARLPGTSPDEVVQHTFVRRPPPPARGARRRSGDDPGPAAHRELGVRRRLPGHPGPADDRGGRADRAAGPVRLLRRAAGRHGADDRAARPEVRWRRCCRRCAAGGLVGLLCDRDIEGTGIEVEFFGERTTMPAGPGHAGAAHRGHAVHGCGLQRAGPRPPGHRRAAPRHHPHRTAAQGRRPPHPGDRHAGSRA